MQIVFKIKCF